MFESVPVADLLRQITVHDFAADPVHEGGASRIDAIKALDRLECVVQAARLDQIAALRRERRVLMPLGTGDPSLSVIGEVAMARNISPGAAGTQFGLAMGLQRLPLVFGLFRDGIIGEAVARAVVRESESLSVDDFVILDAEIAPRLPGLTHVRAAQATRRAVIGIDAEAAHARAASNRADCRVTLCPEPDGVAVLRVRGPAEQMVAVHDTLDAWARGLRSSGDERTSGQIMVATLVERATGVVHADSIDVEIGLVMDAATMLGAGDEPVDLAGYGPLSPDVADDLIARAHRASVRRLLTDPVDGTLLARDPRRRRFDGPLATHIRSRDRRCRQPGCDCKIRDLDHVIPYELGGPTAERNGQGLCTRSHTIKHQPGWIVEVDGRASMWTTPTGHQYRSTSPPLLGHLRQ
ncbi:HNH endonuclease [Aeromicrobium sp.]|uniref:HNH endonuclease signature motif containing protein n=1 Tax=Aeromicrobium sp. TaxID=1871063 RepID=UPI0030BDE643